MTSKRAQAFDAAHRHNMGDGKVWVKSLIWIDNISAADDGVSDLAPGSMQSMCARIQDWRGVAS